MPLPSEEIIKIMKAATYHAEVSDTGEAGLRDYIETFYPHASPYQRRRALELATQAIGVGLALRDLNPQDQLRTALHSARAPAAEVGVRVKLNYSQARPPSGYRGATPDWVTKYVPMRWDQTVAEVGAMVREMLAVAGYTEQQIAAIEAAGARSARARAEEEGEEYRGAWWEFVGPTLFPIT